MHISNVIVTLTYLLTIIVLSSIVFILIISNLNTSNTNSNSLAFLQNKGGLVNAL
jgi:uncharacterized membrane protein